MKIAVKITLARAPLVNLPALSKELQRRPPATIIKLVDAAIDANLR